MTLPEALVALLVRTLPERVRARYTEELTAELAHSSHPTREAVSLLAHAPQLRHAVVGGLDPVPWRCRIGRHRYLPVLTDPADRDAFYLRCTLCAHEKNPSGKPAPTREEQAAWMMASGTEMMGNRGFFGWGG